MSKSFYVLDTPQGCFNCDFCHTKDYDYRERVDGEKFCGIKNMNVDDYCNYVNPRKPDWCPLKELPERKKLGDFVSAMEDMKIVGYNICLDEILNRES